jgi:hypothetical protein
LVPVSVLEKNNEIFVRGAFKFFLADLSDTGLNALKIDKSSYQRCLFPHLEKVVLGYK